MTGNLLVTPEDLIVTADEFQNINSQIQTLTNNMLETIRSLNATWAGEANQAYETKFNSLEDDMARISSMIREHTTDLKEMANNYKSAETKNVETANALQGDIIS